MLSFQEAITASDTYAKRHLLLGNGFSIACRSDIFTYGALLDRADFGNASPFIRGAFTALGTTDFEVVMRALRDTAVLLRAHPDGQTIAQEYEEHVAALKEVLVATIAGQHPSNPNDIAESAYASCRRFLSHFKSVYSLNYDLLLYWTIMRTETLPTITVSDDGFRTPDAGPSTYVAWEVENSDTQDVFYLHGALHLFDAGAELQKYTWINTGQPIIDQVRSALDNGSFPLVVAEGRTEQKKAKIMHSNYLSRGYRSLPKIKGALFVHGHSLADNDDHIMRLVRRGRTAHLFVSLFGDPDSAENLAIRSRAEALRGETGRRRLDFYDASSARVWNG